MVNPECLHLDQWATYTVSADKLHNIFVIFSKLNVQPNFAWMSMKIKVLWSILGMAKFHSPDSVTYAIHGQPESAYLFS